MDPVITGGLVAGGLNLVGDIFSQSNARAAFKSRYQDTVKDMKKAGLNPALAYGQGGGNPQTHPFGDIGSAAVEGATRTSSAKQAAANTELTKAQTELLRAQKDSLVSEAFWKAQDARMQSILRDFMGQKAGTEAAIARETAPNEIQRRRYVEELTRLGIPPAKAEAEAAKRPVTRYQPEINSALDLLRALIGGAQALKPPTTINRNYFPRR